MIPEGFDYVAPRSLEEARECLSSTEDAKVLGGGMSLIPAMKHRLVRPPLLVDLRHVPGLDAIESRRGRIVVGARATHAAIGRSQVLSEHPIFRDAAFAIGDRQVQSRGSLGGSLVHADPAADWPAVFLALDGEATVLGIEGERLVAGGELFVGMLESAVENEEILTSVSFAPETKHSGGAYLKVRHPASGFAVVGVAAQVVLDRKGRCTRASIGVTGVNPLPFRARSLEERLVGESLEPERLRELCGEIDEADAMEDPSASSRYRTHLLGVYAARALLRARERAAGTVQRPD